MREITERCHCPLPICEMQVAARKGLTFGANEINEKAAIWRGATEFKMRGLFLFFLRSLKRMVRQLMTYVSVSNVISSMR